MANIIAPDPIWIDEAFSAGVGLESEEIMLKVGLDSFTLISHATQTGTLEVQTQIANGTWETIYSISLSANVAKVDNFHFYVPSIKLIFTSASSGVINTEIFITRK